MKAISLLIALPLVAGLTVAAAEFTPLPGTAPLPPVEDRSAIMVNGIDRFLMRELERSVGERAKLWKRDLTSPEAYLASVATNRARWRVAIGAVDERVKVDHLDFLSSTASPALVAETETLRIWSVRWPVFEGVFGEGLLLMPKEKPRARVVAIPDADQTPEMLAGLEQGLAPEAQFARRLAESGCEVLVPTLIDRRDTGSGNATLGRFTNQPHREWIYRPAFEMGRHIIGYEVQKVMAAVDWFAKENALSPDLKIGVMGYAEGGLIALYAAALDLRIDSVVVSGYFESRQQAWAEPIYRNVFNLLGEFGDAEIASLIAPRRLLVEHSESPKIDGPPKPRAGRNGAAPGSWSTPDYASVESEIRRAQAFVPAAWAKGWIELFNASEGGTLAQGSTGTLVAFLRSLGLSLENLAAPGPAPSDRRVSFNPDARQLAQVDELVQHTQRLLRRSETVRDRTALNNLPKKSTEEWINSTRPFREQLGNEVIGRFPATNGPAHPKSMQRYDDPKWKGYDVVLDLWPDVFAWGVLLLPNDLKPGERRPAVVCQHGLESLPSDTFLPNPQSHWRPSSQPFAARLAERGFIVFAPHNPYRGEDRFRVLQRKANLIHRSLFSVITAQHERILDWLSEQPFVDPKRIGFYGISYGGKTAMRVPALVERYAVSICSADFNDWITKNASVDSPYSYLFSGEYEMPEFNLGNTFNYAEMAALIAPRPFMVERGHDDGVAPDEWVAHEFARVRRVYDKLGIPERAEIEFFNGPHSINGEGTFRFLHRHLQWPEN